MAVVLLKNNKYRPLPDNITIKESKIEGLGLFTIKSIEDKKILGVSHVKNGKGYWRTPLGGFINHSNNPNCIKKENEFTKNLYLETIMPIKKEEELTVKYTLYKINNNG